IGADDLGAARDAIVGIGVGQAGLRPVVGRGRQRRRRAQGGGKERNRPDKPRHVFLAEMGRRSIERALGPRKRLWLKSSAAPEPGGAVSAQPVKALKLSNRIPTGCFKRKSVAAWTTPTARNLTQA